MKTEKLSLSSIKNVLSRRELKKIMAGSGPPGGGGGCNNDQPCVTNLDCGGCYCSPPVDGNYPSSPFTCV